MKKARERGLDVDHLQESYTRLHQQGAGGQARRHDHHHACLPRQFPLDLHLLGRLRAGGGKPARQVQLRRLFPRIRHRPRRRLRAAALSAEGQQDRRARPGHLQVRAAGAARRTSRGASRKRPSSSRSISCACRRNAASPRPKKATCWPRTSNGRSCSMIVELAEEVWGEVLSVAAAEVVGRRPVGSLDADTPRPLRRDAGRAEAHSGISMPTHHAAIPRRPCRQPAAPGAAEGGARQARQGRDRRRRAQGGRGPRDREDHQEAGGGRPQARHRRRIPPLLVAFRFLLGLARRRERSARRRSNSTASRPRPRRSRSPARSISPAIR